jgi:ankyrin repeat protein
MRNRRSIVLVSAAFVSTGLVLACSGGQVVRPAFVVQPQERPIDQKLFTAIRAGDVDQVVRLLAKGADANANEANGLRPLLSLSGPAEKQLTIAKLLVAKGANINYRQPDQGWTPLSWAIMGSRASSSLPAFLLSKGADPRIGMTDGTSTLHLAVRSGNVEIVKLLLARGAPIDARIIPVPRLPRSPNEPDANLAGFDEKSMREERDRGYEPGFKDTGRTPAFEIVIGFNKEIAEVLKAHGADLKAVDDNGWTILHYAIKVGSVDAIRWLLENGLDPNAPSKAGFRPLHIAMRVGFGLPDPNTVEILMRAGADPKLKNSAGQTPLDLLRSDVAWRARPTDPKVGAAPEFVKSYLARANAVARLLDPSAAPIVVAAARPGKAGTPYDPLDFAGIVTQRTVRIERGRAILKLTFTPQSNQAALTILNILLQNYEPLKPGPYPVALSKTHPTTVEIAFPEAAGSGGAVNAQYKFNNGGGQFAECAQIEPEFITDTALSCQNDVPGRTMQVRLDKVTIGGKTVSKYAGRILKIPPGSIVPTGIPAPTKKAAVTISYSVNLIPNKKWSHETMSLPAY